VSAAAYIFLGDGLWLILAVFANVVRMNLSEFRDLARGAPFKCEGRVYVKVAENVARNVQRERVFFASDAVVEPCRYDVQLSKTDTPGGPNLEPRGRELISLLGREAQGSPRGRKGGWN
jgi:hypothetical protein